MAEDIRSLYNREAVVQPQRTIIRFGNGARATVLFSQPLPPDTNGLIKVRFLLSIDNAIFRLRQPVHPSTLKDLEQYSTVICEQYKSDIIEIANEPYPELWCSKDFYGDSTNATEFFNEGSKMMKQAEQMKFQMDKQQSLKEIFYKELIEAQEIPESLAEKIAEKVIKAMVDEMTRWRGGMPQQ